MSESEAFTLVTSSSHRKVFDDWEELYSAHGFNPNTLLQAALRRQYPDLNLTVTMTTNGTWSAQITVYWLTQDFSQFTPVCGRWQCHSGARHQRRICAAPALLPPGKLSPWYSRPACRSTIVRQISIPLGYAILHRLCHTDRHDSVPVYT